MSDQEGTLNTADSSQAEPTPQGVPAQSGDLVSTVDFEAPESTPPEGAQKTETPEGDDKGKGEEAKSDDTPDAKESKDEGKEDPKQGDKEDLRFDKHPRFQQLIQDKRAMQDQIADLEKRLEQQPKEPEKPVPPVDLSKLTAELWEDDPQEATKIIQQAMDQHGNSVREETQRLMEEKFTEQQEAYERKAIEDDYMKYAKENPDFDDMWDTGELQAYMDDHPGSTAKEAHLALTRGKQIEAAKEEAKQEAQKEFEKTQAAKKTKKQVPVLDSGPSAGGRSVDQVPVELKDTKKFGGLTAVLAKRLAARQAAP